MHNWNIQEQKFFWQNGTPFGWWSWKIGTPLGPWHVGKLIGTLARKSEKSACFLHVETLTREHVDHAGTHGTRFSKLDFVIWHDNNFPLTCNHNLILTLYRIKKIYWWLDGIYNCIMKFIIPKLYVLNKRMGISWRSFRLIDSLLLKDLMSRNSLVVCNVPFLICLFKLLSAHG